jgi:hypothetical protein
VVHVLRNVCIGEFRGSNTELSMLLNKDVLFTEKLSPVTGVPPVTCRTSSHLSYLLSLVPPVTYRTSCHLPDLLSPTVPHVTYRTSCHLPDLLSPTVPPVTYRTSCHLPDLLSPAVPPVTCRTSCHLPYLFVTIKWLATWGQDIKRAWLLLLLECLRISAGIWR